MSVMKGNEGSDYEYAWWKYVNKHPLLRRLVIVWDELSCGRRRDLLGIARAFVREDAKPRRSGSK